MIDLFVVYIIALIVSLFASSWRLAFWALASQSLISGLILIRDEGFESWSALIRTTDLIVVRGIIVPICMIRALKMLTAPAEFETIPANFVMWILAAILLIVSFWFGQALFPTDLQSSWHLGTAISGVLLGLFVLSNQKLLRGQIIGLLTLESGIVLAEILTRHHEGWELQLGMSVVFVWTVALFLRFIAQISVLEAKQGDAVTSLLEEKDVL